MEPNHYWKWDEFELRFQLVEKKKGVWKLLHGSKMIRLVTAGAP